MPEKFKPIESLDWSFMQNNSAFGAAELQVCGSDACQLSNVQRLLHPFFHFNSLLFTGLRFEGLDSLGGRHGCRSVAV